MMLPRLYAIVDAGACRARGLGVGEVAQGLAGAGVRLVQWRNKGGSPAEVLAGAQEIRAAFQGVAGARLMMNDRVDLALLAGFNGVHVGQGDLSPTDVRRVMRAVGPTRGPRQEREELDTEGFVVGVSTHTAAEVEAAEVSGADYVAVGPVFATGTKADAAAVVGLEGVRWARRLTTKPLVAIGGITLADALSVLEAGADSVAVISGLLVEGRSLGETALEWIRMLE